MKGYIDMKNNKNSSQQNLKKRATNRRVQLFTISLLFAAVVLSSSTPAHAVGKYELGRTLYARRCGPCFSKGYKWAPSPAEKSTPRKKWDLTKMALKWSPGRVCTWLRKPEKKIRKGCTPGRISYREKLTILYYLSRRLEGKIRKPVFRKITPTRARNLRLRKRTPGLRKRAIQRKKNRNQLLKMRSRSRRNPRWTGSLKPSSDKAAGKYRLRKAKTTSKEDKQKAEEPKER